ncbi:MAG: EAL domain-containing protein [Betaproteobacteria bacterium]|nr:EAL domain-containing protein [Betaproteobacteria bacterium]
MNSAAPSQDKPLHRLLERQLRRHFGSEFAPGKPWETLLAAISRHYHETENERRLLENALGVNSQELTQANELLRAKAAQEQALLRSVMNSIPDLIFIKTSEGVYLGCNQAFERFLGRPENEIVGQHDHDLLDGPLGTVARREDELTLAQGTPRMIESWVTYPDGLRVCLEVLKTPYSGIDGQPLGLIGIGRNITERKRSEQRERLRNLALEQLARGASLTDVLKTIALGVESERPDMLCTIRLVDAQNSHLVIAAAPSLPDFYRQAIDRRPIGIGVTSSGQAAYTRKMVVVEDITTHPNWTAHKDLAIQAGICACWSQPILGAADRLLGTFAIYFRTPRTPDDQDLELVIHYANIAAIAIERGEFEEQSRLSSLILKNSGEGLVVTDEENRIIAINPAFTRITGYSFEEVKGQNPRLFKSDRHDRAYFQAMWRDLLTHGQWQGEIWDRRKNGETYAKWLTINTVRNEDGSVHRYVALFSDITEKKQSEELIWTQANFDSLTTLPNRNMFRDRLSQELKKAARTQLQVALLLIDLDKFKDVNDTLGHDVGDILLQETARRIQACVRASDTVARLGGDEFAVIIPELDDSTGLDAISHKIIDRLAEPYRLGSEVAFVSASIGIALYPDDAADIDTLIKNADQAMYAAKNSGRNRHSYFTLSLHEAAQRRVRLTNDLRSALAAGQFLLHYQPIVEMATGRIHKAEALIRWRHPVRGLLGPMDFIPLAEETGMVLDIGNWVFSESVRQAARWRQVLDPDFQVSVNRSPVQFYDQAHNLACLDELKALGVPGRAIIFEITEQLLLDAQSKVSDTLLRFRDAEIQVAIDDFGTGYSSLSYLRKFDVDYLKIDRSFVEHLETDPNNVALCEAIIVMARRLGLKVIAEGVETLAQRNILAAAGCDYAQGYLFAQPIPPEAFETLVRKSVCY